MNYSSKLWGLLFLITLTAFSCVSKKKYMTDLNALQQQMAECDENLDRQLARIASCESEKDRLANELRIANNNLSVREEQMSDLRGQLEDLRKQRENQLNQVQDLTKLSQSATTNIQATLSQLEGKDKYIRYLQAARTRADSINLALAVNLKGALEEGIEDEDVEVKVDKTVVFVNLSDKMLYNSGSYTLTSRANEVLAKIARIVKSRPDLEVMVEGYTDNVPIKNNCVKDNWDLSVLRSTSVVRALQTTHGIDPNRLIAAGRGEWNALASNATADGRATNRRTRIIILPKLDQFYDLLNPNNVPE